MPDCEKIKKGNSPGRGVPRNVIGFWLHVHPSTLYLPLTVGPLNRSPEDFLAALFDHQVVRGAG